MGCCFQLNLLPEIDDNTDYPNFTRIRDLRIRLHSLNRTYRKTRKQMLYYKLISTTKYTKFAEKLGILRNEKSVIKEELSSLTDNKSHLRQ